MGGRLSFMTSVNCSRAILASPHRSITRNPSWGGLLRKMPLAMTTVLVKDRLVYIARGRVRCQCCDAAPIERHPGLSKTDPR